MSRTAKVGTLCIIDTRPRTFCAEDIAALEDLAAMVEDERAAFKAATLTCLDLDGFKEINDLHGHSAGDAVLRRIADRMKQTFRSSNAIARMGGDEFVALMPGAGETDARLAVIRLRR